jgi:hypothetical protein
MSQSYMCTDQRCYELSLWNKGEVIEHVRTTHREKWIIRPAALGVSDSHGRLWYCFNCETRLGKDHRSFQSDEAMWSHLNDCHDSVLDMISKMD